jgi:chromosome segregation ATPase
MSLVNEFAENLREGKVALPERDDSAALRRDLTDASERWNEERKQLAAALASATRDAIDARRRCDAAEEALEAARQAQRDAADSLSRSLSDEEARKATADASRAAESALKTLREENAGLKERMLELSRNIPELIQAQTRQITDLEVRLSKAAEQRAADDRAAAEAARKASERAAKAVIAAESRTGAGDAVGEAKRYLTEAMTSLDGSTSTEGEQQSRPLFGERAARVSSTLESLLARVDELSSQVRAEASRAAEAAARLDAAKREAADVRAESSRVAPLQLQAELKSMLEEALSARSVPLDSRVGFPSTPGGAMAPATDSGHTLVTSLAEDPALKQKGVDGVPWDAFVGVLEELQTRLDEVERVKAVNDTAEQAMALIASRQASLYKDFVQSQSKAEGEARAAEARETTLRAELDAARAEIVALKKGIDTIQGKEDAKGSSKLKALTRELATVEAHLPALRRRLAVAEEELKASQTALEATEEAAVEAETVLRQRVLYLELWKMGAEVRLDRLSVAAREWVPAKLHRACLHSLASLRKRHHALLADHAAARAEASGLRRDAKLGKEAVTRAETLAAEVEAARGQRVAAEAMAAELREALATSAGKGNSLAERQRLEAEVARLRSEAAAAQVTAGEWKARAETMSSRVAEMSKEAEATQRALQEAETRASEARMAAETASDARDEAMQQAASGVSEEEAKQLRLSVETAEARAAAATAEVAKYRGAAEAAAAQATSLLELRRSRTMELQSLRGAIRDLAERGDLEAAAARLQARVLAGKAAFAALHRRHQTLSVAAGQAKAAAAASELVADSLRARCISLAEEARAREAALEEEVSVLRARASDETTLAATERLAAAAEAARVEAESRAQEAEDARQAKRAAEAVASEAMVRAESAAQLAKDLQTLVDGVGLGTKLPPGVTAGSLQASARRIVSLSAELREARLAAMRAERSAVDAQERGAVLERKEHVATARVLSLEEQCTSLEYELRRFETGDAGLLPTPRQAGGLGKPSWEKEDEEAEKPARELLFASDQSGVVADLQADVEAARASSRAAKRRGAAQRRRADALASRLRTLRSQARALLDELEAQGVDVSSLGIDIDMSDRWLQDDDNDSSESDGGGGGGSAAAVESKGPDRPSLLSQREETWEREKAELRSAARRTINGLKALLQRKTATIQELQERLEAKEREIQASAEAGSAERVRLADRAHLESSEALHRLRDAAEALAAAPVGLGPEAAARAAAMSSAMIARCEEAEQEARDMALRHSEAEAHVARLRAEVAALTTQIEEERGVVKGLQSELESQKQSLEAKAMERMVATLRGHLKVKDKKLQTVTSALSKLKEEFLRAQAEFEEELAKAKAAGAVAHAPTTAPSSETEMVAALRRRLEGLQQRVAAVKTDLESSRTAKTEAEAAAEAMRKEKEAASREAAIARKEAARNTQRAEAAEAQIQSLRKQLEAEERSTAKRVASAVAGTATPTGEEAAVIEGMRRRMEMLEAQNAALRTEAVAPVAVASSTGSAQTRAFATATGHDMPNPTLGRRIGEGGDVESSELARKLQRRVEVLSRRLKAAEEANSEVTNAADAATTRADRAEKTARMLEKRIKDAESARKRTEEAAARALGELAPAEALRRRLADAEEEVAVWRRKAEGELVEELAKARGAAAAASERVEAAEREIAALERERESRIGRLEGGSGDPGLGEEVMSLRERLRAARREVIEFREALGARSAELTEARFSREEAEAEAARWRRRCKEAEAASALVQVGARAAKALGKDPVEIMEGGMAAAAVASSAPSGAREAELESAVTRLRRVAESQREEIARLRTLTERSEAPARPVADSRQTAELQRARDTIQSLEATVESLRGKIASLEHDAPRKSSSPRDDAVNEWRRKAESAQSKARSLDEDLKRSRSELDKAHSRSRELEDQVDRLRARSDQLESQLREAEHRAGVPTAAASSSSGEVSFLREALEKERARSAELATRIESLEKAAATQSTTAAASATSTPASWSSADKDLREEVERLKRENAGLKEELGAFDLEFFEELEDLKWRHSRAVDKCAAFDRFLTERGLPPYADDTPKTS